jgi:hypothetical protein
MTSKSNAEIAMDALKAFQVAMALHCRSRGIEVVDLSNDEVEFFTNTALVKVFSSHTRLRDTFRTWRDGVTVGDLKVGLEERRKRIEANNASPKT